MTNLGQHLSPFLLLDYAGPAQFAPAPRPRGVGEHPHRGFETVTIVYQGEVAHRDSVGNFGVIGPGDVQWMTAASGILHEEFHSPEFTRSGGAMEMAQLWVNLPAVHKMSAPRYQTILKANIPQVELADGSGSVRVIAGSLARGRRAGSHGDLAECLGPAAWGPDARLHCRYRRAIMLRSPYCAARCRSTVHAMRGTLEIDRPGT